MTTDKIKEITIDDSERLCIFPEKASFTQIFRLGKQVYWDNENKFLYSPKPREWSYHDWYQHIINVAQNDYDCGLLITDDTVFTNIPESLKKEMLT